MDLRQYVRIARRRWRLIVACLLIAIAGAAFVTMRTTPQYASTARLFILTPSDGSDAYQGGLFSQQRVTSYADLIKGKQVAQRVIDRLDLTESATALASRISSNVAPQTVILEVTVTDSVPLQAQRLATAVAEEFTEFVGELETPPGESVAPIKATIIDKPGLPTTPVLPQPLRNIGIGAVIGLLVGIGLAVIRELLDTTVKTADTLNDITGSALLGSIYFDPAATKRPLVTQLDSHAPRVEAFRMLRTNLQFVDIDRESKTFLITSALPSEGKSTTAINLAVTLAQAGQRVVLLEADLRRPRVAEYLHLEPTVGLTTVLIGRVDLADAIQPWGQVGLDVITSGAIPPNPAELLQSKAMDATLTDLRDRYDVIVIDAPPLLPVTDAAILAAKADGAVLVARHGKTTKDQCADAIGHLRSVDAKVLGSVLNMVPERGADGYGYGYGYGYGPLPEAKKSKTSLFRPGGRKVSDKVVPTSAVTDRAPAQLNTAGQWQDSAAPARPRSDKVHQQTSSGSIHRQ